MDGETYHNPLRGDDLRWWRFRWQRFLFPVVLFRRNFEFQGLFLMMGIGIHQLKRCKFDKCDLCQPSCEKLNQGRTRNLCQRTIGRRL
ncbi:uncharacterized protein [Spinacia oleracea]|uniref:Uncharacterized protein isoform X2 n=1 Tax=Spinacia oleracea TaxID=3562 RepID=A0ABM3R6Q4_SPIOL|nr:uncharacterized protein LOC110800832 isoform X2 [Spinacia oleracea]